jgi:hypothetical protein
MKLIVKALLKSDTDLSLNGTLKGRSKVTPRDSGVFSKLKEEVRDKTNFIKREVSQQFPGK